MVRMTQGALPYTPKMSRMPFCPSSDTEESDMEDEETSSDSDKCEVTVKAETVVHESEEIIKTEESNSDVFVWDDEEVNHYEMISATAMALDMLVKFPDFNDIIFEISCGCCLDDNGPFILSCASGHALCTPCFQEASNEVCKVEIMDTPNSTIKCGASFYEIDEAIKNTPYYKNFMEAFQYDSGSQELGCDAVLPSEEDIEQHELDNN